jgi:hypothetical protein
MPHDSGAEAKARLRNDLVAAMKLGQKREAGVIRGLIAAIDNAEAAPARTEPASEFHDFRTGSAEVARLALGRDQVRDVILREIDERERAAADFAGLGKAERAEALQAEVVVAMRYLDV